MPLHPSFQRLWTQSLGHGIRFLERQDPAESALCLANLISNITLHTLSHKALNHRSRQAGIDSAYQPWTKLRSQCRAPPLSGKRAFSTLRHPIAHVIAPSSFYPKVRCFQETTWNSFKTRWWMRDNFKLPFPEDFFPLHINKDQSLKFKKKKSFFSVI